MFTGIVEETGALLELGRKGVMKISARKVLEDTRVGDSVSVSGVCLTVVEIGEGWFAVDVMPETVQRSSLATLRRGARLNLERALGAGGRLGGHIVNGHIDGTAKLRAVRSDGNAQVMEFETENALTRYMVPKGSVAVDGVSLTVLDASEGSFSVSVIPHTLRETTLAEASAGTTVNVEVDILAKYVEAFLSRHKGGARLEEALQLGGYMQPEQGE